MKRGGVDKTSPVVDNLNSFATLEQRHLLHWLFASRARHPQCRFVAPTFFPWIIKRISPLFVYENDELKKGSCPPVMDAMLKDRPTRAKGGGPEEEESHDPSEGERRLRGFEQVPNVRCSQGP